MKIRTKINETGNLEAYIGGEFIGEYSDKEELIEIFESEHGITPEVELL